MGPFDFFDKLASPPLDRQKLPPEAATLKGFADAIEEITRALNIIAKYDSTAMAEVWDKRLYRGDWDMGPVEEDTWPQILITAQRIRGWVNKNPDLVRLSQDLRTIGIDWPAGKRPEGLH